MATFLQNPKLKGALNSPDTVRLYLLYIILKNAKKFFKLIF